MTRAEQAGSGEAPTSYEQIPERLNVTEHFLERNLSAGRGEQVALVCDNPDEAAQQITYLELVRQTNRAGHVLRQLGVRREERVLLALADGLDFVSCWFGVLKIGAVVAEVYTFLKPEDYAYYLNYTRAGVVVADASTLTHLRQIRGQCPALRTILVAGRAPDLRHGEESLAELAGSAPAELETAPTSRDDIALWKFTTGSTGAPKAAVHCHHDPVVSHESYALGVLGLHENDRVLAVPKLFFGYARDLTALFNLGAGGTGIVFPDRTTPVRLFDLIEQHRPTVLVQVPTMMSAMVSHPDAHRHDLGSVRLAVSSGETLPDELHRRWLETFGVEVVEGVGSSELYHIYISNRLGETRPGSAGRLVPGYTARVADADGVDVPVEEPGELWVSGESAALFYWNDHRKSKQTFAGDEVRTGDLFARDPDGYFYYRGRADDLLKVGGIWVAPVEIEACLLQHPGVAECAVGPYTEEGLALPRAYVVRAEDDEQLDAAAVVAFARERLSPHKAPRDVVFTRELPKTASGKIDRRALERLADEGS